MTLDKLRYLAKDILNDLNKMRTSNTNSEEAAYINGQKSMLEWMIGQIEKG